MCIELCNNPLSLFSAVVAFVSLFIYLARSPEISETISPGRDIIFSPTSLSFFHSLQPEPLSKTTQENTDFLFSFFFFNFFKQFKRPKLQWHSARIKIFREESVASPDSLSDSRQGEKAIKVQRYDKLMVQTVLALMMGSIFFFVFLSSYTTVVFKMCAWADSHLVQQFRLTTYFMHYILPQSYSSL